MTYRARNIGLAVGLGLVAVLLVTLYVKNSNSDSPSTALGEKLVGVFIASHDISAGTPGSELTSAIQSQQVLRSTVVAGAISSKDQVKGLVSTAPILAGQQVTQRQFQRNTGEGISGEIARTQRAYQLAGDANQLLVNTLQPGDRVDVLASIKYAPGDLRAGGGDTASTGVASRIMLRNLLVLQQPRGARRVGQLRQQRVVRDHPSRHRPAGAEALLRGQERRLGADAAAGARCGRQPRLGGDDRLDPHRRAQGPAARTSC